MRLQHRQGTRPAKPAMLNVFWAAREGAPAKSSRATAGRSPTTTVCLPNREPVLMPALRYLLLPGVGERSERSDLLGVVDSKDLKKKRACTASNT